MQDGQKPTREPQPGSQAGSASQPDANLGLIIQPVYGVFLRLPEDNDDWIHPDDIGIARRLIPSNRILKRTFIDASYYRFSYGSDCFRGAGRMWLPIDHEGFDVGDRIEVTSNMGQNWPILGEIAEVRWNRMYQQIEYHVDRVDGERQRLPHTYAADQIQLVHDLASPAGKRPGYQPPLSSVASPLGQGLPRPKFDGR